MVSVVAGAGLDAAFAARSRDAVSHCSASDGVDEGGLSTTCNKIYRYRYNSGYVSSFHLVRRKYISYPLIRPTAERSIIG